MQTIHGHQHMAIEDIETLAHQRGQDANYTHFVLDDTDDVCMQRMAQALYDTACARVKVKSQG